MAREKKKQSRTYGVIIPSEWENAKLIILKAKQIAKHYYYIEHDKDCYTEDGENGAAGELKKKHIHLLFTFNSSRDLKTVANYFSEFPELKENSFELIHNAYGAKRYLIHADNPEKSQYYIFEVETNDPLFPDCFIQKISSSEQIGIILKAFEENEKINLSAKEYCLKFSEMLEAMTPYQKMNTIFNLRREWRLRQTLKGNE